VSGAALAFFAFLGFDIVATSAEETERPQRDVPFGIIASVAIATVLYVAVSGVLTGLAPYTTLNNPAPVATALSAAGSPWISHVILVGSVVALTKGALMIFYGQTRLLFAMSRDRLLPEGLSHTDPRTGTPNRATVVLAILAIAIAGFLSIDTVAELVNLAPSSPSAWSRSACSCCGSWSPIASARSARRWCRWCRCWRSAAASGWRRRSPA
jgi:APA family basic amino acid/polyamine antiporter